MYNFEGPMHEIGVDGCLVHAWLKLDWNFSVSRYMYMCNWVIIIFWLYELGIIHSQKLNGLAFTNEYYEYYE